MKRGGKIQTEPLYTRHETMDQPNDSTRGMGSEQNIATSMSTKAILGLPDLLMGCLRRLKKYNTREKKGTSR